MIGNWLGKLPMTYGTKQCGIADDDFDLGTLKTEDVHEDITDSIVFLSLVLKRNGKIRHLKTTSIPPCEFCFISCVGAKSSRPPICYSTRRGERQVLQRRYPQRGHKPRLLRHAMWPEAAVFARINTTTASDTHCYRGN